MLNDLLNALGIKGSIVAAGLAGGLLRALSRRRYKLREMIASPLCGMLASAYLTLPAVHYVRATGWPLPAEDTQAVLAAAFLIGSCAMWITDILFELIVRRFRPREE
ncbi:MAG: hypothetical protein KIS96_14535 [Bauldia sp.]|nr:hypothetical protein [Bauldia sp.]